MSGQRDAEDILGAQLTHRDLVDRARASHVRWGHEAEVLEECLRPLCLGAKVLLWPNPDDPGYQPIEARRWGYDGYLTHALLSAGDRTTACGGRMPPVYAERLAPDARACPVCITTLAARAAEGDR